MKYIDINCDMGESFGKYIIGHDAEMMSEIVSANVACGFHAGDANVMGRTVKAAKENGVSVGAHPGYPDLAGFGRRYMVLSPEELYNYTVFQVGSLNEFLRVNYMKLSHIKPHGVLYNTLIDHDDLAEAFARACADIQKNCKVYFIGSMPGNCLEKYCEKYELQYIREFNCDTDYTPDGKILIRKSYDNITPEGSVERAIKFLETGEVAAADGTILKFKADSICVHGDSNTCVSTVRLLKSALNNAGYSLKNTDCR